MDIEIKNRAFNSEAKLFDHAIESLHWQNLESLCGGVKRVALIKASRGKVKGKFALLERCGFGGYVTVCPVHCGKLRLRSQKMLNVGDLFTWAAKQTNDRKNPMKYYATSNIEQFVI